MNPSLKRERRQFLWGLIALGFLYGMAVQSQLDLKRISDTDGLANAWGIIAGMAAPDFTAGFLFRVIRLMGESFAIGFLGLGLALVLGIPLALFGARLPYLMDSPKPRFASRILVDCLRPISRFILSLLRSIPEIIWAFLFVRMMGLGPGPAVIAIGLTFGGIIGKLFAELMESCPPEPGRTLRAGGASAVAVAFYGVLPQIRHQWVGYGLFRLECAIRSASILGVVGAGGIGSEIELSIRYFQYDKLATALLALLFCVILLEAISVMLRGRHAGWSLGFVVLGFFFGVSLIEVHWKQLVSGHAWKQVAIFAKGFMDPTLEVGWLLGAFGAMFETLCMAAFATAVAALGAFVLAPLGSKHIAITGYLEDQKVYKPTLRFIPRLVWIGTRMLCQVFRAVPELVWALIFVVWVGAGPMAGTLAIAAHTIGILGRLFGEVYEDIDPDAARSMEVYGASRLGTWAYGVLPQALRPILAYTLFRFEVNVRATAMVGFVGAGGIGDAVHTAISLFHFRELATLLLILIATVFCVDILSSSIRHRILVR